MYAPYKTKGPLFSSTAGGPLLPTASAGKGYTRSKRQTRQLLIRILLAFGVVGIIGTVGYYSLRKSSSGGFKAPQDSGTARGSAGKHAGKNTDGKNYEAEAAEKNKWKEKRHGEHAKRIAQDADARNNKEANQGEEVASLDPVEQFRQRRRQRQEKERYKAPEDNVEKGQENIVQQEAVPGAQDLAGSQDPAANNKLEDVLKKGGEAGAQVGGAQAGAANVVPVVPVAATTESFYNTGFELFDANGIPFLLSSLHDKVTLVVNVASQCGYTASNYQGIQKVLDVYGSYGFEVLAFPCNDFGSQEPKSVEEISTFVKETYNSTVRLMKKVDDINHNAMFEWLRVHAPIVPGGIEVANAEINWNFNKFLVDKKGNVVQRYPSDMNVSDLEHAVYAALVKDTPDEAGGAVHHEEAAVVTS